MTALIRKLSAVEAHAAVPQLASILMDCVAGGASVSFLAPLSRKKADSFFRSVAAAVSEGERILLAAEVDGVLVGTVQVILQQPENQPHRADVAKMLVHRDARRQGIGEQLMAAAELEARAVGKTLLVLDTASGDAERLYQRLNWVRVGIVPGFALLPNGEPCDTCFYYKFL